jgi:hypothetical protein
LDLETSDWVLIGTTTILAISALFVPYLAEWLKKKYFAPKLEIIFKETPRLRHKTRYRDPAEPVYYFRFEVVNIGMAQARQCEIVLEKLWSYDNTILPQNHPQFAPTNLLWTGTQELFININPGRRVIGNIGHISSDRHQQVYEKDLFVDMIGVVGDHLRFRFDIPVSQIIYAQPNSLIKGDYIVEIKLYSENAENRELFLKISWSEEWKDNPEEMFREITISKTEPPVNANSLDMSNLYYDSIYRKIYEV